MTVTEKSRLLGFLEDLSQQDWLRALDELGSAIHPVDREATRIWFAFWPLELHQALTESKDAADQWKSPDSWTSRGIGGSKSRSTPR